MFARFRQRWREQKVRSAMRVYSNALSKEWTQSRAAYTEWAGAPADNLPRSIEIFAACFIPMLLKSGMFKQAGNQTLWATVLAGISLSGTLDDDVLLAAIEEMRPHFDNFSKLPYDGVAEAQHAMDLNGPRPRK